LLDAWTCIISYRKGGREADPLGRLLGLGIFESLLLSDDNTQNIEKCVDEETTIYSISHYG
jgi:hypothetical protein